jgi:copper(I)-binding protein
VKLTAAMLCGCLFMVIAGSTLAAPTMDVIDGWVREAPPTSRVLAAYMRIINLTEGDLTVTGITSPDFEAADLHRTVVEDGVARMLPVPELTIPAGGSITLEPGGLHLMLFDPVRPLQQGDSVTLVLHRSDDICITLSVPVLRGTGAEHVHHQH